MPKIDEFQYEDEVLKTYVEEDIAIINVKCNVFNAITDLAESGKFISLFHIAERAKEIKAILLLNEGGCYNEEEYENFLSRLQEDEGDHRKSTYEKVDRTRQINILNRVITQISDFKKISVFGLRENVVTPFFGSSLAADFRFANEDMSFSLAHLRFGVHPGGALPFFLPHYVGHGKAVEILLKGEKIEAKQALELGLITEIFPTEGFEKRCLAEIHKLCQLNTRVINTTKLLLNFSRSDLRRYFDVESALIH